MNLSNLALPYINFICAMVLIALFIGVRSHAEFYLALEAKLLERNLNRLKNQLHAMLLCALILAICAFMLSSSSNDPLYSALAGSLSSLYAFVMFNLIYIYYLLSKARREAKDCEKIAASNEKLVLIIYYFLPLNIVISLVAVFLAMLLESQI